MLTGHTNEGAKNSINISKKERGKPFIVHMCSVLLFVAWKISIVYAILESCKISTVCAILGFVKKVYNCPSHIVDRPSKNGLSRIWFVGSLDDRKTKFLRELTFHSKRILFFLEGLIQQHNWTQSCEWIGLFSCLCSSRLLVSMNIPRQFLVVMQVFFVKQNAW